MRAVFRTTVSAFAVVAAVALGAGAAEAKCKRMGFLVNDYGKDGPTKDAQALLDKHVATWAAENGISKYTIGKKDVSCELFLNFIVFDEHTCTASANVCWDEPGAGGAEKTATGGDGAAAADKKKKKAASEAKPADRTAEDKKPAEAKADDTSSKAAEPSEAKAAEATNEAPKAAPVETGTLPATADPAPVKPAADPDAAEKAAAAAERAAAAAERAAAAAERAAKAASEKPASQLEMPGYGAGAAAKSDGATPATVDPVKPAEPKP